MLPRTRTPSPPHTTTTTWFLFFFIIVGSFFTCTNGPCRTRIEPCWLNLDQCHSQPTGRMKESDARMDWITALCGVYCLHSLHSSFYKCTFNRLFLKLQSIMQKVLWLNVQLKKAHTGVTMTKEHRCPMVVIGLLVKYCFLLDSFGEMFIFSKIALLFSQSPASEFIRRPFIDLWSSAGITEVANLKEKSGLSQLPLQHH